jgi:formylglycine-generating enzyme required for sulfatase activity
MAEPEDGNNPTFPGNLTDLRRELAHVRAEADREIARLRQQVAGAKPRAPARDSRAAAEQLALEQELTALRRTLAEKDRTLDGISHECRRLEDAIEDEHRAADVLRQELERKDRELASEHKAATEFERERDAFHARLLERHPDGSHGVLGDGGKHVHRASPLLFLAGVGVGLAVAVAVGLGYLGLDSYLRNLPGPRQVGASPAPAAPSAAEGSTVAAQGGDAGAAASAPLPRVRDRLPDGTTGPLMVTLPAGRFTMGSPGLSGERDEQPEHEVRIGGFLIAAQEVTFADFDRFARATGRRLPDDFGWGRGTRPVVDVSWTDAQAFAQWLSRQTGRHYRLPSEAEWEYAARGGTRSSYWWGFAPEPGGALCFDCGTTWDGRSTAPVGSFDPNPFGLHDTAGNAMEWAADCYRRSYEGAPVDGTAWNPDRCAARVARGGAFNKPAKSMRSAARADFAPDTRINMLGFRLARDE